MNAESRRTIAVFDFDGTLTVRDTSFAFIGFAGGKGSLYRSLVVAALLAPLDLLAALAQELAGPPDQRLGSIGGAFEMRFHLRVLRGALRGRPMADLEGMGREWGSGDMRAFLDERGLDRVRWHRERGDTCYLVSASIDLYLTEWASGVGFEKVLATRLASCNGVFTGRFDGPACWGRIKLQHLRQLVGDLHDFEMYGYGDSRGDRDFLAAADHAFIARGGSLLPFEETESF